MSPEKLKKLQEKFLSGLCTREELEELMSDENFTLIDRQLLTKGGNQEQLKHQILNQLRQSIDGLEAGGALESVAALKAAKPIINYYYAAAAVFALVLFAVIFLPTNKKPDQKIAQTINYKDQEMIKPGEKKATLTLSNGTVIDLRKAAIGTVSRQGNVTAGKAADGKLIYKTAIYKTTAGENHTLVYNTITTPRGGEYMVVLPDGTKVWLNAESSLRFPSLFTGSERNVELRGEAYFEVAKNKEKAFKVAVDKMGIEVLGTHFNVNAYPGEASIKTTLLEGAVKLTAGKNHSLLSPGHQASFSQHAQSTFRIRKVNVEEAIAWKKGYFIFDNENIQEIMKKIARWYDIEVDYRGNIEKGNFGGTVSRFDNVSSILKSLELTGTVHFKVEGRRITVMP